MAAVDSHAGSTTSSMSRAVSIAPWLVVTSAAVLVVSIGASAVTLWASGMLIGPAAMNGSARGTALVVLLVAVPTAAAAAAASVCRGRLAAPGVWLGAVGYLAYNAALFLFATPYNRAFLLYVAMLGLAVWTFGGLLAAVRRQVDRLPRRSGRVIAGYLGLTVAMTASTWLRGIIPSITAGRPAAVIDGLGVATNPVYIQDLALGLPASAVTAVLIWRRRPGSGSLAIAVLVYFTLESATIAIDQWFAVHADPTTTVASAAAVPVFAVLTVIDLIVLLIAMRRLQSGTANGDVG